jgi:hypothetical protein
MVPSEADRLEHHVMLAESRHNLVVRLIEDHRVDEAAALVATTVASYKDYAALAGADLFRVARDLAQLGAQVANAGGPGEAVVVQQALVDLLAAMVPSEADRLEHHVMLAESRHNLVVRLIEDHRLDQAAGLVAVTVASYKDYAALAGADRPRVARDLAQLAAQLESAGLPNEAQTVRQAAAEI